MKPSKDPQPRSANNSIVDVAVLARVSVATVSRVLSGQRDKNDDVDRRVRQAAATLNYSVNAAAKALRSKVSGVLGVVAPKPIDFPASQLISELEPAAKKAGKNLALALAETQQELDDKVRSLILRDIDGLIVIAPQNCRLPSTKDATNSPGTPIIQLLGHNASPQVSWIGIDTTAAMRAAMQNLADANATSIAFLSPTLDSGMVSDALVAFQSSDQITELIRNPAWTTCGACTIRRGYDDALRMFADKDETPDGIICGNDQIALGVLQALNQLHIVVPDQVMVVSFGDSPLALMSEPSLTSVCPPYRTMAHEAIRLLLLESEGTRRLYPHTTFPPQIIDRGSTRKLMHV